MIMLSETAPEALKTACTLILLPIHPKTALNAVLKEIMLLLPGIEIQDTIQNLLKNLLTVLQLLLKKLKKMNLLRLQSKEKKKNQLIHPQFLMPKFVMTFT